MSIVVEEADETEYWLEIINEANLSENNKELERLQKEILDIIKIVSKARKSTY